MVEEWIGGSLDEDQGSEPSADLIRIGDERRQAERRQVAGIETAYLRAGREEPEPRLELRDISDLGMRLKVTGRVRSASRLCLSSSSQSTPGISTAALPNAKE